MKKIYQSASLMCLDFLHVARELEVLEKYGVEYLHIDVMDGHYVPNVALGSDFCKQIKKATKIPLDIHFMVDDIDKFLPYFDLAGSMVSFHPETSKHPLRTIAAIRERGGLPGIAIDPAFEWKNFTYMYEAVDFVLVMSVNPGYAGQKLIPSALAKTRELRDYLDSTNLSRVKIEIDGNVSWENIPGMVKAGAEILVTGTSSVFSKEVPREETFARFNKLKESL